MAIDAKAGQNITVVDIEGGQVVDFFAESAETPNEFLSTGVTIDCNESLKLQAGDMVYTNFYHNGDGHPNCLDNINGALGEKRPMICPVNLFMYTEILDDGRIAVRKPLSKAGSKVVLKAKMDVRLGIAACSVSESDCNSGKCTSIKIIVED